VRANVGNASVLIVEEDAAMLRALAEALSSERFEVNCASWLAAAVQLLADRRKSFDLVITDLLLPLVNGKNILKR